LAAAEKIITRLKEDEWFQNLLNEGELWIQFINNCKAGAVYDEDCVVFFKEPLNLWITRLLRKEKPQ
jgi:hypothetical protein